ncbi:GNAT family N-acetyltransferase [Alteromonas sp. C1M14]|nr:GNAT family N-acetyltransferase [Alteromonas sp. C1M14]
MIDLSTLPSRLPAIHTTSGPINIERIGVKHTDMLCEAAQKSIQHVRPWLGTALCPLTPAQSRQCIQTLEEQRSTGYGITYLLILGSQCLGMGLINHIHPVHQTANLGYWIRPETCGQGLAGALCEALKKLAFSQAGLHRLEMYIEPNNKASLRVALKVGAEKEGLCRKRIFGRNALLYALTAD